MGYNAEMSKLDTADIASLELVKYPDPRLREVCTPVGHFDDRLRALVEKMFAVMYKHNGVGLAASQVGVSLSVFVANPTGEPTDERVYVNPRIIDNQGRQDGEEGCLSFPAIYCKVRRYAVTTIRALDLAGNTFEQTVQDMPARIIQHECDHLEGRLLVDRMSPVARIANRRSLKDLESV